jgi:hypothetical protein
MLSLLSKLNYIPPKIVTGKFGRMDITLNEVKYYYLTVDGVQWMAYDSVNHVEAYDVYSHYILAEGHVICSGMGFGSRENWLLTKPEVTKLTILEKNAEIFEYHKQIRSPFLSDKRVEVVIGNASDYKGSCDVLLLDHYELQDYSQILADVNTIQKNIECRLLWFWPIEQIIMHCRKWHSDNDAPYNLITKLDAYNLIKKNHDLYKLPELDSETLNLFCMMFNSKLFSKSEFYLSNLFKDRKIYHEIYRRM